MENNKKRNFVDKLYDMVIDKPGILTFTILIIDSIVLLLSISVYVSLLLYRQENFYINDLLQIFSYNISIVSFIVAIVQLSNFLYHNKFDMKIRKKEKSIKAAQIYAEDILCEISFISNVLRDHLGEDGITSLVCLEHKLFNCDHYEKLNLKQEIKSVFSVKGDEIPIDLINKNKFISKKFSGDYDDFEHIEPGDLKIEYNRRFRGVIIHTLNLLEGMAMEINDGVCDGELLFKPLHKTFIKFVKIVSPCIYSKNSSTEEISYSNVIKLYRKWVEKQEKNVTAVIKAYNIETDTVRI